MLQSYSKPLLSACGSLSSCCLHRLTSTLENHSSCMCRLCTGVRLHTDILHAPLVHTTTYPLPCRLKFKRYGRPERPFNSTLDAVSVFWGHTNCHGSGGSYAHSFLAGYQVLTSCPFVSCTHK